jgi:6-phosphofructokinase 1
MTTAAPQKKLAILTSGGDAPGMNAAVRAAARVGLALGYQVVGVEDGYRGLMEGRLAPVDLRLLDASVRRGGTVLGTARSAVFPTPIGQARARQSILEHEVTALLVIGGNGSLTGARTLMGIDTPTGKLAIAGLPASIDNDLACTQLAIGVDTALNTIVDACDRICDTATSHRRTFIVEVMGRDSGYLAMTAAIASGAEVALVPELGGEVETVADQVVAAMEAAYGGDSGKRRVLVIKSEGAKVSSAELKAAVDTRIATRLPDVDTRVTVLGHVVRGGSPTAFDRLLGSRLANAAVRALADGQTDVMAGWMGPGITRAPSVYDPYVVLTPITEVLEETARLHAGESELARWRRRALAEVSPIMARMAR